jgi:nucleoside-diphosphate-sugar epimerase
MLTNIVGLYNMLQAAVRGGVRVFVNTGTNCVYGHGYRVTNRPFEIRYLPIDEDHPSDVEDSYSFSKKTGESLMEMYAKVYGIRCYSLRAGFIAHAHDRAAIKAEPNDIDESLEWLSAWIAAEDLATAHRMLMDNACHIAPYGHFNCMSDDTMMAEPTMELINKYLPHLLPSIREPLEGHASLFSSRRLKEAIGWEPKIHWR